MVGGFAPSKGGFVLYRLNQPVRYRDSQRKPLWRNDLERIGGRIFDVSAYGTTTYGE